jgi:hypothetical protein
MGDRCLEIAEARDQPGRMIFSHLSGNFSPSRDITVSGGSPRHLCKTRSQLWF